MNSYSKENINRHELKRCKETHIQKKIRKFRRESPRIQRSPAWSIFDVLAVVLIVSLIDKASLIGVKGDIKTPDCNCSTCENVGDRIKSWLDETQDPCDDFFQFACGGWRNITAYPPWKESRRVPLLRQQNLSLRMKCLLESVEQPTTNDSRLRVLVSKMRKYYRNCMDLEEIETGTKRLSQIFSLIPVPHVNETVWKETEIERYLVDLWFVGIHPVMTLSFGDDKMTVHPPRHYSRHRSRVYYTYPSFHQYRRDRGWLIEWVLEEVYCDFNISDVYIHGETIVYLETEIVEAIFSKGLGTKQSQWTVSELIDSMTKFNWSSFLDQMTKYERTPTQFHENYTLSFKNPAYIKNLYALFEKDGVKENLGHLATFLLVEKFKDHLPVKYKYLFSYFNTRRFRNRKVQADQWEVCVDNIKFLRFPDLLSHLYADKYFDEDVKTEASEMISYVTKAYHNFLKDNTWVDEGGRRYLIHKLQKLAKGVGYPKHIGNIDYLVARYGNMICSDGNFLLDELNNIRLTFIEELRPVPTSIREWWLRSAGIIDLHSDSSMTKVYYPMGAFAYPLYEKKYPKYLNYGGIGTAIGREIAEILNHMERHREKQGKYASSPTNATNNAFNEAFECLRRRYQNYEVPYNLTMKINPSIVEQAISEEGGVKRAFEAYRDWVEKHGNESSLPGLQYTPSQLFFINYAQNYCTKRTKEGWMQRLGLLFHGIPNVFRVTGALSVNEYFREAFKCREGDRMRPRNTCSLW